MKKNFLFVASIIAICICSCESVNNDDYQQSSSTIEMTLEFEPIETEVFDEFGEMITPSTRSYLNYSETGFSFGSLTGDSIVYYFKDTDNAMTAPHIANVRKTDLNTTAYDVTYPTGIAARYKFYSYYCNNTPVVDDPTAVTMSIPANQSTESEKLIYQNKDDNGEIVETQSTSNYRIALEKAMPQVGEPKSLTKTDVNNGKYVKNITYRNLGSIYEARIYSSTGVAVGEKIKTVILQSTDGTKLNGSFTVDATSSTSAIQNIDGTDAVFSYVNVSRTVPQGQANYVAIDLILAPGTFPARLIVVTDQHQYYVAYDSKTYKAGVRKSCYVNLASAICRPLDSVRNWTVTASTSNCFFTRFTGDEITPGNSFLATLSVFAGYQMSEVTVTMGGNDVTADVYDAIAKKISIPEVTGDVEIIANATPIPSTVKYSVTDELNHCYFEDQESMTYSIEAGDDSEFYNVVVPFEGYTMTGATVRITMGGVDITDDCYDPNDHSIYIAPVTGDIFISISSVEAPINEVEDPEED